MYITKNGSCLLDAHRGVSTEYPENTMPAFVAAVKEGYEVIELDPSVTKDGIIVFVHDATINRAARNKDGSEIEKRTYVDSLTYDELCELDFGIGFDEKFKGTKAPTLDEVLDFAAENNIILKIDAKLEKFRMEELMTFVEKVKAHKAKNLVTFTVETLPFAEFIVSHFPDNGIDYSLYIDEWHLKEFKKRMKNNHFTVWLRLANEESKWCYYPPLDDEQYMLAKKYADSIGIWILTDDSEAEYVIEKYKPRIIETTGSIKPNFR